MTKSSKLLVSKCYASSFIFLSKNKHSQDLFPNKDKKRRFQKLKSVQGILLIDKDETKPDVQETVFQYLHLGEPFGKPADRSRSHYGCIKSLFHTCYLIEQTEQTMALHRRLQQKRPFFQRATRKHTPCRQKSDPPSDHSLISYQTMYRQHMYPCTIRL